ncbi:hypothetical protein MJO28_010474 [Puccinia striiformis f. sp. tritici]|uniref:Transcription elongation factor 1 homolog n=3 Tax=Puccinia striiformis TaxID=27350 RepID=A0A0L0UTU9_9BASI|nr:hypothetical protein Pst134EA_019287 [Puccinia striiformis f. sp. tritici]KAI9613944.1 hypothetical protein H4Q26_009798 [Puccinia striiformis f. sp. tritici PST-130]KNE90472.1 hypothetical protein PSTG_16090 [Puccinia striiformis f. sp. tritici PST-78]POW18371.1 hypothetical protein PSHT_05889 [Puccinia striiformis]KAH9449359.1 hypothetical protein Pst134EB_020185 [Puccinia striiformis f. sp. tritici]KAH9459132.1 hypothetical protein Pst134EA_019287 [Puccinia striiformis f. sp. tritici]
MGKRKAAKKPNKKAKLLPLDKIFRCLFCQRAGVVHCKLDRQEMVSRIECSKCGQHFETKIDHLMEPIDVYSLWIDAAEAAAVEASQDPPETQHHNDSRPSTTRPSSSSKHASSSSSSRQQQSGRSRQRPSDDHFDDGLDDEDGDLPDNIF